MRIKRTIIGFLKLIRIELCLFATIGLFVAGILAGDLTGIQYEYLIGFLLVFISAAGAFAINDYFDFEIDIKNSRKDRPIVSKAISRISALYISIIAIILVIFFSLIMNITILIYSIIWLMFFYAYSIGLKKIIFIKNITIAFSYTATIILGSLLIDSFLEPIIIYFAIMGFIIGLGSEIMFDIADLEGDKALGVKTIPIKYGKKKAAKISVFLYIIIIILDPLPFFILIDHRIYLDFLFLGFILVPVISYIILSWSLLKDQSKENTLKLRKIIFIIMQIGTISYLVGVIF